MNILDFGSWTEIFSSDSDYKLFEHVFNCYDYSPNGECLHSRISSWIWEEWSKEDSEVKEKFISWRNYKNEKLALLYISLPLWSAFYDKFEDWNKENIREFLGMDLELNKVLN